MEAFFEPRITYLSHTKKPKQQRVVMRKSSLSEKLWENSVKKVTYMAAMALQIYRNKESNASLNYLSIKLVCRVCTM